MKLHSDLEKVVRFYNVLVKFVDASDYKGTEVAKKLANDHNLFHIHFFLGFLQGEYSGALEKANCPLPKDGGDGFVYLSEDYLKDIAEDEFDIADHIPPYAVDNCSDGGSWAGDEEPEEGLSDRQRKFLSVLEDITKEMKKESQLIKEEWHKVTEENKNEKIPEILKEQYRTQYHKFNGFLLNPEYELEDSEIRFGELDIDVLDLVAIKLAYHLTSYDEEKSEERELLVLTALPRLEFFENLFSYTERKAPAVVREKLFDLYGEEEGLVEFCDYIADRLDAKYDLLEEARIEHQHQNAPGVGL